MSHSKQAFEQSLEFLKKSGADLILPASFSENHSQFMNEVYNKNNEQSYILFRLQLGCLEF